MELTREIEKDVLSSFYKYRQLPLPNEIYNYLDSKYPRVKNGMWVKYKETDTIIYITDIEKGFGYGLDECNEWIIFHKYNDVTWSFKHSPEEWQPATKEEVIAMLEKEAIKRGYVKGAKLRCLQGWDRAKYSKWHNNEVSYSIDNVGFWIKGINNFSICIMKNGEWAEIISEPNKEIHEQIKKLEKELNELKKIV